MIDQNSAIMNVLTISQKCRNSRCGNCEYHTTSCFFMCAVPGVPAYWNVNLFTPEQINAINNCIYYLDEKKRGRK